MALKYRTQGFVFKKEDRLETDRVFSIFTKDFGRIEVLGKAIRKIASKLRGGINLFSLSEVEFIQGKNKKTLVDAVFINKFNTLSENPDKLLLALKISEVLNNFIKGEERDERIFNLLNDIFNKLNNYQLQTTNYSLINYYFFWNFISIIGYGPELQKCAVCRQNLSPENLYFSDREGGVICKDCKIINKNGIKITPEIVKVLRLILKKEWETLVKLRIEDDIKDFLKELSDDYHKYLLRNIYPNG